MFRALTIAGSDSGGGAGIQADLKTFQAFGVYGMSALTAVTAQNTLGVRAVQALPAEMVLAQLDAVAEDLGADAVKTGMLANRDIVEAVAEGVARHRLERLVVDPVLVAKGGAPLLDPAAVEAVRGKLLPLALLATPNLPEAEALLGRPVRNLAEARRAARDLLELGPRAVLLKGGHGEGPQVVDILATAGGLEEFRQPRLDTPHTHGTGCTLSAAIAAALARGEDLRQAVVKGLAFVAAAIATAPGLGHGHGPLEHRPPAPGGEGW